MDGKFTRPCVHDCAAQLPHRYRRHNADLVGGRLRRYRRSGGFDGNLLPRRWNTHTNTFSDPNRDSYSDCNCNAKRDSYADGDSNANSDRFSDGNCNGNTYGYTHGYSEDRSHAKISADACAAAIEVRK